LKDFKETSNRKKKYSRVEFQEMEKLINLYLQDEGFSLNFNGYSEIRLKYFRLQDTDLYETYQLMIECNLWSNYMIDVENIVQFYWLDTIVEKERLEGLFDKKAPDEQLEKDIKFLKKKVKDFAIFHKQIIAQKVFFEKAFWHCYKVYGKATNTLLYKTFN